MKIIQRSLHAPLLLEDIKSSSDKKSEPKTTRERLEVYPDGFETAVSRPICSDHDPDLKPFECSEPRVREIVIGGKTYIHVKPQSGVLHQKCIFPMALGGEMSWNLER